MISVFIKSLTPCETFPLVNVNNLSINWFFKTAIFSEYSSSIFGRIALSAILDLRFLIALENKAITTPRREGVAFSEASFTSPALSPKIARSNFSSGEGSDSPFGVILPIKISPGSIRAPTRTIPRSSKSFVASSLTFGISEVNSSIPRLVSRTSRIYSSTCTEVKKSSLTMRSFNTIASS